MSTPSWTRADRLLEAATAGREVSWRGAPGVGAALVAELAGVGVAGLALGLLGLLIFAGFVALAPAPQGPATAPDPVAIGGLVVFVIALLAVGPPLVLDTLELRNTRYAIARDGVVIVTGVLFLRAILVRPPFPKLERLPGTSGTILLGEAEQARLGRSGASGTTERLHTRLRGLGPAADAAFAELVKLGAPSAPASSFPAAS